MSAKTGGALWFPDLTVRDATYLLPLTSAGTMLLSMEIGARDMPDRSMAQKWLMRGLSIGIIPLTAHLPAGVFLQWISTSLASLGISRAIANPTLRKRLNVPPMPLPPAKSTTATSIGAAPQGFMDQVRGALGARAAIDAKESKRLSAEAVHKLNRNKPAKRRRKAKAAVVQ